MSEQEEKQDPQGENEYLRRLEEIDNQWVNWLIDQKIENEYDRRFN